jgi:hypothetical protein
MAKSKRLISNRLRKTKRKNRKVSIKKGGFSYLMGIRSFKDFATIILNFLHYMNNFEANIVLLRLPDNPTTNQELIEKIPPEIKKIFTIFDGKNESCKNSRDFFLCEKIKIYLYWKICNSINLFIKNNKDKYAEIQTYIENNYSQKISEMEGFQQNYKNVYNPRWLLEVEFYSDLYTKNKTLYLLMVWGLLPLLENDQYRQACYNDRTLICPSVYENADSLLQKHLITFCQKLFNSSITIRQANPTVKNCPVPSSQGTYHNDNNYAVLTSIKENKSGILESMANLLNVTYRLDGGIVNEVFREDATLEVPSKYMNIPISTSSS